MFLNTIFKVWRVLSYFFMVCPSFIFIFLVDEYAYVIRLRNNQSTGRVKNFKVYGSEWRMYGGKS